MVSNFIAVNAAQVSRFKTELEAAAVRELNCPNADCGSHADHAKNAAGLRSFAQDGIGDLTTGYNIVRGANNAIRGYEAYAYEQDLLEASIADGSLTIADNGAFTWHDPPAEEEDE